MPNPFDVEAGDGNPFGRQSRSSATPELAASGEGARAPASPSSSPHETPELSGLTSGLENLQRQASALQDVLNQAMAESPALTETAGTDRSEAITVVIGTDALPLSLRVSPDWERKIRPEQFGPAVTEASHAARTRQMSATADVLQRPRRHEQTHGTHTGPEDQNRVRHSAGQNPRQGEPRPLNSLAEHALQLFDAVERLRPQATQGTGHAAEGRFTITLSAEGLVSCSADPQWVSGKAAATLTAAFHKALGDARSAIAGNPPSPSPVDELKDLFDETIALLQDPRRLSDK